MGLVVLGSPRIYGAGGHLLGYGVMGGDHHGSMGLVVLYGARGDGQTPLWTYGAGGPWVTTDLWGWQSSMGHVAMDGDHCGLMGLVVLGSPWPYGAGGPWVTTDLWGWWSSFGVWGDGWRPP